MFSRLLAFVTFTILAAGTAFSDQIPKYDRDLFGGWSDTDRDCQNMRHELLQDLSTAVVSFSQNACRVTRGRWLDPYTDKIFHESRLLDIDHLVPLNTAGTEARILGLPKSVDSFQMIQSICLQLKKV